MEHNIESTLKGIGPAKYAKLNHCCNDKVYVQSSKAQEIALDGNYGKCSLHTTPMFDKGLALRYTQINMKQEDALHYTHVCV